MSEVASLWDELYIEEDEDCTLFDWFGLKAYTEYRRWIGESDKRILDAGAGSGRFCIALAEDLPASEIVGIDISEQLVRNAQWSATKQNLSNVSFKQDDIFQLSFPDDAFDVVFNQGVIEHFEDSEAALREMIRVAKPGGKVIVGVPIWYCFPHTIRKWLMDKIGHEFEYGFEKSFRHEQLKRMFRRNGLIDLEMTGYYFMHSLTRLFGLTRLENMPFAKQLHSGGRALEKVLIKPIDLVSNNRFSTRFGFEIVIKGIKGSS